MKDFFGTVIEVGDAVVVALHREGIDAAHLELLHVTDVNGDECAIDSFESGVWFGRDEIISMKSVIGRSS